MNSGYYCHLESGVLKLKDEQIVNSFNVVNILCKRTICNYMVKHNNHNYVVEQITLIND